MKLKQRVVMLVLLALICSVSFLVGTQLNWTENELTPIPQTHGQNTATVASSILTSPHTRTLANDSAIKTRMLNVSIESSWSIWNSWVTSDVLYPANSFNSKEMNQILTAMATSPITSFGVGHKGTQLKATVMLVGAQRAVFKPKRYDRDHVILGDPYAGFDRHNGEIAGFHLDGILGFHLAPPVVGRVVNLTYLAPLTSSKLLQTYFHNGGNTCFYGVCYYCKHEEAACADGEMMEGSLTLWLPEWYTLSTRRHPYQRTYEKGRKARWETDVKFCLGLLQPTSDYYHGMLEFTDSAIYDFLMGNADRHHYETYSEARPHGRLLHIDNGKTFGNPTHDEMSILAPLKQCCRVRRSTWERLESLSPSHDGPLSQILEESLKRDPLHPILSHLHLEAIDRRFLIVMATIQGCISEHSADVVLVDSWGELAGVS